MKKVLKTDLKYVLTKVTQANSQSCEQFSSFRAVAVIHYVLRWLCKFLNALFEDVKIFRFSDVFVSLIPLN